MRVLEVLARFADAGDVAVLSYAHVARAAGCTRTHARRVLRALEEAGLIERGHRRGDDGRWLANAWLLRVDRCPPAGGAPVHMPPPTPPSVSLRRRRSSSPAGGGRGSRSPPRRRSALSTALSLIHKLLPTRLADQLGDDRRAWRGLSIALSQRLAEGWRPGELARVLVGQYQLPRRIRTSLERLLCARASRLEGPAPSAVAAARVEATERMLSVDRDHDRQALPDAETFDQLDDRLREELLEDAAARAGQPPTQLPRDLRTHRRLTRALARDLARTRGYLGSGEVDRSAERGSESVAPGGETRHTLTTCRDASTAGDRHDGETTLARATRTVRCSHCGATRKTRAYGGIPLRCPDDECGRYFTCPAPGADGEVSVEDPDDDAGERAGQGKPSSSSNGRVRRAKRARTSRSSSGDSDDGGSSSSRRGVLPWQR